MAMATDCELLGLVRSGDQQGLVALHDRYSTLVYSISFHVLRNANSAEDVVQEIFMKLWRSPSQVSITGDTLHGWFIVASRNRSISLLRKECSELLDDSLMVARFDFMADTERRLMCEKLVGSLDCEQRDLLEMAYLKEMSHSEIASSTGYPLGTIKSRIRSAIKKVRKSLISIPEASIASDRASLVSPIITPRSTVPTIA